MNSSKFIKVGYIKLFGVFLYEDICELFWCVYLARIVLVGHEVIVDVIIVSHSNCINALTQVILSKS